MIFDTHAHYDDEAFDTDREELLGSLKDAGITSVMNVAASLDSCVTTLKLAETYDWMYAAQGIHPSETAELDEEKKMCIRDRGYVVASVEYRYSDEGGVFPAQVQDLKAAIRYLRAHAGEYQIDPDRIALWGDSSGGHTVALAALSDGVEEFDTPEYKEQHSNVKCCVDFYGVFEFESMCETMTPELIQYFEGDPIEKLFGGPISEHQEEVKRANLAGYITRDKVIPPFLLVHGDEDAKVHFTQSVKFYNLLKDNGHSVEFYKVKGGGHGNRTWTPEVMGLVKEFLRAYL